MSFNWVSCLQLTWQKSVLEDYGHRRARGCEVWWVEMSEESPCLLSGCVSRPGPVALLPVFSKVGLLGEDKLGFYSRICFSGGPSSGW